MTAQTDPVLFSIISPIYNTDPRLLEEMVTSVMDQTERSWELLLIDDHSPSEATRATLGRLQPLDPRIAVTRRPANGGISEATNDGLAAARGTFIVLLDHDDTLAPQALERIKEELVAHPETDYLYTDEDKIDAEGAYYGAFRKPAWSPSRLLSQMYTSHASVFRRELLGRTGAFRSGFDGSQDHDLVLRAVELARGIRHVPEVLYHWRAVAGSTAIDVRAKDYAWDAGVRAVDEALARRGLAATAAPGGLPGTYQLRWRPESASGVTIVLSIDDGREPSSSRSSIDALSSVLAGAEQIDVEIVVVHGSETAAEILHELDALRPTPAVRVLDDSSRGATARRNLGSAAASRPTLLFLDEHIRAVSDDLLQNLVGPLTRPSVGATAPRSIGPDGLLRDAGFRYALTDYRRPYLGREADDPGEGNALFVDREVSALASSCLAISTETFRRVGGFNGHLSGDAADLDLGRKLAVMGLQSVWLASAEVTDTRPAPPADLSDTEIALLTARWGGTADDPYIG